MARAVLAWVLLSATLAVAGQCDEHYAQGRMPEIRNPKLQAHTRELCYGVFGVMHSGLTRTPLWSAERLEVDNIESAATLTRKNSFHAETKLPRSQRAELSDYARSGFDRGHMAPNGNMPDEDAQRESFSLANMVPQDADNNRHTWAAVEMSVRKMARLEGRLYVLTGPAFLGSQLRKVGNVLVPSHLYKVVYSPKQGKGAAYFVENNAQAQLQTMTVAELERLIGINLLPALTLNEKQQMARLPRSKPKKTRRERFDYEALF
ncbi:MAG: DNA/RNA non-specific endonuclease [Pseudomonadota bacterium]